MKLFEVRTKDPVAPLYWILADSIGEACDEALKAIALDGQAGKYLPDPIESIDQKCGRIVVSSAAASAPE